MQLQEKESNTLEFKSTLPQHQQIFKTLIGFCNLHGGRLLIGVDDHGNVLGLDADSIDTLMEYLHKSIYESCAPVIIPHIYSQRFGNQLILCIEVSEGMNKPYFLRSQGVQQGTYMRLGRSTVKASPEMIQELQWTSRGHSVDEMPVHPASFNDLDSEKILHFLKGRKGGFRAKHISDDLKHAYKLTLTEHSQSYPTIASLLLFGKDPQYYLPEAFMICSHFSGTSGRNAVASIDCKGTLFEQFEAALAFLTSRLSKQYSIHGSKRQELLEIPVNAIREVLMNAIAHRSYQIPGPTKIALYDDRLEVFSPGSFPGPLQTDQLEQGITYIRNRAIAKILREAGYLEKLGSGFITLFESYRQAKLKKPMVIEGDTFIKCVLPRGLKTEPAESSEESIITHYLHQHHEIRIHEAQTLLNVSRATAGRRLKALEESNILRRIGSGPSTRYVLV